MAYDWTKLFLAIKSSAPISADSLETDYICSFPKLDLWRKRVQKSTAGMTQSVCLSHAQEYGSNGLVFSGIVEGGQKLKFLALKKDAKVFGFLQSNYEELCDIVTTVQFSVYLHYQLGMVCLISAIGDDVGPTVSEIEALASLESYESCNDRKPSEKISTHDRLDKQLRCFLDADIGLRAIALKLGLNITEVIERMYELKIIDQVVRANLLRAVASL